MVTWPGAQPTVHSAEEQTAGVNVDRHVGTCGSTSRPRPRPRPRGFLEEVPCKEERPRPGPQPPALPWVPPPWLLSTSLHPASSLSFCIPGRPHGHLAPPIPSPRALHFFPFSQLLPWWGRQTSSSSPHNYFLALFWPSGSFPSVSEAVSAQASENHTRIFLSVLF